jgi:hypothetical protein
LQAAILSNDQKNLLTLIASTPTSPFKKASSYPNPPGQQSYGHENSSSGEAHSDKDGNSSVNTPKFANSFASNPQVTEQDGSSQKVNEENAVMNMVKGDPERPPQGGHGAQPLVAQVDDFPKLIEQMRQKAIAVNLLDNVVDFASLIQKLLVITHTALCVFRDTKDPTYKAEPIKSVLAGSRQQGSESQDPIPPLVQNCMDLLLPCILWEPRVLMKHLYGFADFEQLLIDGLMRNPNERIRKSID